MKDRIKKVLLIDPPGSVVGLNTGLAYLTGTLLENNYKVKILDFNNFKDKVDDRLRNALMEDYGVIGFSLKSLTIMEAMPLIKKCKRISPKIPIIAGGPGVTVEGRNFLRKYPIYDYALIGEAEYTFLDFLKFLNEGKKIKNVKGLSYRKGSVVSLNENEFILDLNGIPLPDYSTFDFINFERNNYPLATSRGCPYNCSYCSVRVVSGRAFRARSPLNVVKELELAKKKYKVRKFEIYDDAFTQDVNRAKDICRLIIKKKLNLSWICENGVRADRIDRELVRLMRRAGCREIWLGIESLDPKVFALVGKGEGIEDILGAIQLFQKEKMMVGGFFIIGLPGSTYERDKRTLEKAKKLGLHTTTWSLATAFPGTFLWNWVKDKARILRDYNKVSFFVDPKCTFETKDYKESERLKMFYKANLAFHRYTCLTSEKNLFKKIFTILRIIWRVDRPRFPEHLIFGIKTFLTSGIIKNYFYLFKRNFTYSFSRKLQKIDLKDEKTS